MVDVSLPVGTLGFFKEKITKFLFLPSYRVSHNRFLERSQAGKHFQALGEFFEFDLHLESDHLSNATVPMSFVVLRNRSGQIFSRIEVHVQATARHVEYQDFTTLIEVGERPVVINLPRIPLKEMQVTESDGITTTYDNARVSISILDDAIPVQQARAKSHRITPSYTEFLNSEWDKKWDVVWNLDYIETCKNELRDRLRFYFVTRNRFPMEGEPRCRLYRKYKHLRLVLGRPFHWVLGQDRVIAMIFWVPIFIRLRRLASRKS
jgi:hypothetical protein